MLGGDDASPPPPPRTVAVMGEGGAVVVVAAGAARGERFTPAMEGGGVRRGWNPMERVVWWERRRALVVLGDRLARWWNIRMEDMAGMSLLLMLLLLLLIRIVCERINCRSHVMCSRCSMYQFHRVLASLVRSISPWKI